MESRHENLKVASAVQLDPSQPRPGRSLGERLLEATGSPADICFVFASAHFEDQLDALVGDLSDVLSPRALIGCTGESVICDRSEYEGSPAVVVLAGRLPGLQVRSFHLSREQIAGLNSPEELHEQVGVEGEANPSFVLVGEPFSLKASVLEALERLSDGYSGSVAIGGMASAGEEPGQNRLIFDGHCLSSGLTGVALWGSGVRMRTIVSQGCRPIGRHFVITRGEQNIIHEIGGRPAMDAVAELLEECEPHDVELVRTRGLLVGRVINEYQRSFAAGDFLIRNPIGFDPDTRAMAVNDLIRTGQTIQFQVRDSDSAAKDLETLLREAVVERALGALLFTCNGRGTRLYDKSDHDARALAERFGPLPVAGFFCAGEIGPVGGRNFLHGHTASIGVFEASEA